MYDRVKKRDMKKILKANVKVCCVSVEDIREEMPAFDEAMNSTAPEVQANFK